MRLCTGFSKLVIIEIIIISSHRRQSTIAAVNASVILINDEKTLSSSTLRFQLEESSCFSSIYFLSSTIRILGAASKRLSAFTVMSFVIYLYVWFYYATKYLYTKGILFINNKTNQRNFNFCETFIRF